MLTKTPRFRRQFRNGTWHIFDAVYYGVVGARDDARAADREVARLNKRHAAQ